MGRDGIHPAKLRENYHGVRRKTPPLSEAYKGVRKLLLSVASGSFSDLAYCAYSSREVCRPHGSAREADE